MAKSDQDPTVNNPNPQPNRKVQKDDSGGIGSSVPGMGDFTDPGAVNRHDVQKKNASLISDYNNQQEKDKQDKLNNPTPPKPNNTLIPGPDDWSDPDYKQTAKHYDGMAGWDVRKLNDDNVHDAKYDFGRSIADFGHLDRGNLQSLVDYYNATYGGKDGGNFSVTGEDTIHTPQGWNVDIINGDTNGAQWLVL